MTNLSEDAMLKRWLSLLVGVAFVLAPACGGGGGIGDDGVHVLASAVSHISPDCAGGGATGDN
jgi:hypothetical protein